MLKNYSKTEKAPLPYIIFMFKQKFIEWRLFVPDKWHLRPTQSRASVTDPTTSTLE